MVSAHKGKVPRAQCQPGGIPAPYGDVMDVWFECPDCRATHDQPADAGLGLRVRCLECQTEIDLAYEIAMLPRPKIAA